MRVGPGAGAGPSPAASLANTLLSQPSTSSSHCPGRRPEVRSSQLQLRSSRRLTSSHLLELQQEGALVLAPAVLLHALFDELVQDGGDGLRADPLQQLQLGTERYIKGFSRLRFSSKQQIFTSFHNTTVVLIKVNSIKLNHSTKMFGLSVENHNNHNLIMQSGCTYRMQLSSCSCSRAS